MLGGLKELIAYPWTSLPTILGRGNFPFVDVSGILRRFDEDPEVARKRLLRFLADGLGASSPFDEAGEKAWGDSDDAPPQIVGSEQFVAGLRAKFESASGIETDPVSWFDELVVAVANERGVDALDLLMGRRLRDVCEARAVVAARAFFVGRLSVKEIASRLGITTTATSRAITRGRSLGATDLRVLPMLGS